MTLNEIAFNSKESLQKINTLTKYPSIATYHTMINGKLQPELTSNSFVDGDEIIVSEKIDGTNSRIMYLNGDWIIGSRENLLFAKGDRIGDPAQGIVDIVKPIANNLSDPETALRLESDTLYVFYGESYGGKITKASREYSKSDVTTGFRLFDVVTIPVNEVISLMNQPIESIASWREGSGDGHNKFVDVNRVNVVATYVLNVKTVPYHITLTGADIPNTLEETYEWLQKYSSSVASLDNEKEGLAEGVVVRTRDRSIIRKIRFQDYERTLGLKKTR